MTDLYDEYGAFLGSVPDAPATPEPPPAGPKTITAWEFRRRFTLEERVLLDSEGEGDNQLSDSSKALWRTILKDFDTTFDITKGDPDVTASINFFVSIGVLSAARASEILDF